jgi:diacylglycerol kinase (ATP)
MPSSGVIINPRSGRGNQKGMALASALVGHSGVHVELLHEFSGLETALRKFISEGVDTVFISSGDGTVQATQTFLAENKASPRLCILPHGTTNMTAADVGFRHTSVASQVAMIADPTPRLLLDRPTLRVENPRGGKPRHGMFLGTGAIGEAARYAQTALNDKGVKGSLATFATLAGAVGRNMFTKSNPYDQTRFDRPFPITVRAGDEELCSGFQLLALVTTLDKLILGSRPFWGGKNGPLRVTTFPYPPPNIVRWLLPSVMGGEDRRPPPGAKSKATTSAEITTPLDFVIDGEFFSPTPGEALRISVGPTFTYVVS